MTNPRKTHEEPGKDTSPLELDQLSDSELVTILEIERRLYEVQESELLEDPLKDPQSYLALAQKRDPRVLLMDGGRGTGKTSLLLTLVRRWHDPKRGEKSDNDAYKKRIELVRRYPGFEVGEHDFDIPEHVQVLRVIDFDPLPPGMPLIAGIVQSWKPLAERYDELSGKVEECDDDSGTLMDRWHQLFQVAAVGWTGIPGEKGLIEQILDRAEQVQDWQRLGENWQSFVNRVIKVGMCLKDPNKLAKKPAFVIMIDDVDLQVERIRELLPALRMLYHPRVVFIVAADQNHMVDMLELNFLGQQNRLANRQPLGEPPQPLKFEGWPDTLAKASFQKVFPPRNIWKLKWLSLRELLDFPPDKPGRQLKDVLNQWEAPDKHEAKITGTRRLGEYLYMAGVMKGDRITEGSNGTELSEASIQLPPIMSYRTAQQIDQLLLQKPLAKKTALEGIRQIIRGSDSEDLVRVTKPDDPDGTVEYLATGELAALFYKGFGEGIDNGGEVVLSARPNFMYRSGHSRESVWMNDDASKIWPPLIAVTLRDAGYGLIASGLQWNVHLALAWSRVLLSEGGDRGLDLAFWWRIHELPAPMRLLDWAREWEEQFVRKLSEFASDRLERIAYAWIYYQLRWMSVDATKSLADLPGPFEEKFNLNESWDQLLSKEPEAATAADRVRWKSRTLPLMARPELGLPVAVQGRLLGLVKPMNPADVDWLKDQRRRLVTDAILAAAHQTRASVGDAEDQKRVERLTGVFEERHKAIYGKDSSWFQTIEGRPKTNSE